MNITLKPMKLQFIDNGDGTWSKIISNLDGGIVMQELNIILLPEMMTTEYFNEWETQLVNSPFTNIVEVERFM